MKRFADIIVNGSYVRTNIWEVCRGEKQDPHKWKNITYWSTHRRNKIEMFPVRKKPNSFFKYKNANEGKSHEGHDVTLTHEVVQDIVANLKEVTFKVNNRGGRVYKIYVSNWEIEELIKTPNGNYYIDILFKFNKSEPESLVLQWNGRVAVEIHVTNAVKPTKVKDLLEYGIPILEHTVSKKLYIDESRELTLEDISKKKQFLGTYYEKEIYVNLLEDYYSKEYIAMEIPRLQKQVSSLEEENAQLSNKLQKHIEYVNRLKSENTSLSGQIISKNNELNTIKIENEQFKKTLWYKLYKVFTK